MARAPRAAAGRQASAEIAAWLASQPDAQRATLETLRRRILALGPGVVEQFKWSRPCYARESRLFCYLFGTRHHATLGFHEGARLDDPDGLLEGTGKDMRHVKFAGTRAADTRPVLALLAAAFARAAVDAPPGSGRAAPGRPARRPRRLSPSR